MEVSSPAPEVVSRATAAHFDAKEGTREVETASEKSNESAGENLELKFSSSFSLSDSSLSLSQTPSSAATANPSLRRGTASQREESRTPRSGAVSRKPLGKTKTVLIVGRGLYALQLARCFHEAYPENHRILLATSAALDFARASFAVDASFVVPKADSRFREFCDALAKIILENGVDLVVPAAEETMFLSLALSDLVRSGVVAGDTGVDVLVPSFAQMAVLHDKHEFQAHCSAHGFPCPRTVKVQTVSEALEASMTFNKCVVKPVFTRGGRAMCVLHGDASKERNLATLNGLSGFKKHVPHVVQEFIAGEEFSCHVVAVESKIQIAVTYACAFPVKGFSTVRTAVSKPAMLEWIGRFLDTLSPKFSGQLGFDFIETAAGEIFALECNPRATNGVSFFACSDEPHLARSMCDAMKRAASAASTMATSLFSTSSSASEIEDDFALIHPTSARKVNPVLPSVSSVFSFRTASPSKLVKRVSIASDLEGFITQPLDGTRVATFLPAISLVFSNPSVISALRQAQPDVEWLRDPMPLVVALVKALRLATTSLPHRYLHNVRLADLAADETEKELVKFDAVPSNLDAGHSTNASLEKRSPRRILVTGASGFLGSHLVRALVASGTCSVIATGRRLEALEDIFGGDQPLPSNVEIVCCDLLDRSALRKLMQGVDTVIHCAAYCSPWGAWADFERDNVDVTKLLIEAASSLNSNCERFVHVSSPSICFSVQRDSRVSVRETDPLPPDDQQSNYYALSKAMAERVVASASANSDRVSFVTIRPRAIFGKGDRALFPRIVSRLRECRLPQLGDGSTVIDLTHVSNVVEALMLAASAPKEYNGRVYNITDCSPVKLWDQVIFRICRELDMPLPRFTIPASLAYKAASALEAVSLLLLNAGATAMPEPLLTRYAVNVLTCTQTLDCSRAARDLGYRPVISTEHGIRDFLDSIRAEELVASLPRKDPRLLLFAGPAVLGGFLFAALTLLVSKLSSTNTVPWTLAAGALCLSVGAALHLHSANKAFLTELARHKRVRAEKRVARELAQSTPSGDASLPKDPSDKVRRRIALEEKHGRRARPWRYSEDPDLQFEEACRAAPAVALSPATKSFLIEIYALFKQERSGDMNPETSPRPSLTQPIELAKWNAWKSKSGMTTAQARQAYIECIDRAFDALDDAADPEGDREADENYVKTQERVLYKTKILGVGRYRPKLIMTNEDVERRFGLEPGWISKHNVGVKSRRWADPETEPNSFQAAQAVREACAMAGCAPHDLDLIINASASNERMLPDGSCLIKRALGLEKSSAACFSVHATCLSFITAFELAASLIACGRYKRIAIVSAEIASVGANPKQPESATLLGDGAAAAILGPTPKGESSCVHRAHFENYCEALDAATLRSGTLYHPKNATTKPEDHLFDMDGPSIVNVIRKTGGKFLERVRPGLSTRLPHDIDLVVPHQPSGAGMDVLVAHGWPRSKTINILEETGNCVAASTPMALEEAVASGKLQRGHKFLLCGTGGGVTLGAIVATY